MSRALGIKLEVDPKILPRDVTLGTKIIVLLPQRCKLVRDFKKYVAESVLKTPVSVNLYIGEYRLRDEEDVLVFTCFPDPCRVVHAGEVKTPSPTRQGSTTCSSAVLSKQNDLLNGSSDRISPYPAAKRVKFNHPPINLCASKANPLPSQSTDVIAASGFDQIDESSVRLPNGESLGLGDNQIPGTTEQNVSDNCNQFNNAMIVDESVLLSDDGQRKRKRRRRRHKKTVVIPNSDDDSFNQPGAESTLITAVDVNSSERKNVMNGNSMNGTRVSFCGDFGIETDVSPHTPENSSFKMPQPRKSILKKTSPSVVSQAKNDVNTCSSTVQSDTLLFTPVCKRSKSRQDTPILPRVLKNPGTFEMALKNLGSQFRSVEFHSSIVEENESQSSSSSSPVLKSQTSIETLKRKEEKAVSSERDENFYDSLNNVNDASDINVGDTIAFKSIEMDEKYCPRVSPYQEALITLKDGNSLTLHYIRKEAIERTGIFEISDDDLIGDQIDETKKEFSTLISVKMVKTSEA